MGITDDDIDAILGKSKQMTEQLKDKWMENTKKSFEQLTLEFNYQTYDGEDYTQRRKERLKQLEKEKYALIESMNSEMQGKSTRNIKIGVNYDEDAYFRSKLNEARSIHAQNRNVKSDNKNGLIAPERLPDIRYWQLYDVEALYAIYNKEWAFFVKYKNAHYYDKDKHVALTDEEKKEKEQILVDGFDWVSYQNYGCFVRSVIKYGKDGMDEIVAAMIEQGIEIPDASEDEKIELIKRYYDTFFDKGSEIEELQNSMQRIEEGEERRRRRVEREKEKELRRVEKMKKKEEWNEKRREWEEKKAQRRKEIAERQEQRKREAEQMRLEREKEKELRREEKTERFTSVLNLRMDKWKNSLSDQDNFYKSIQLPEARRYDMGFDKELDIVLFMMTHRIGYGNWKQVKANLMRHPSLQLNLHLRCMTEMDLKNRMDTILRACSASKPKKKRAAPTGSEEVLGDIKEQTLSSENSIQPPMKKRKMEIDSDNKLSDDSKRY